MGFKKKTKKTTSPAPKPITPEGTTQVAEVQPEATETPPWTVKGCNACDGSGINSKGEACRACDIVSGRTGGPTSSQYKTWVGDDGKLRWSEAEGETAIEGPDKAEAAAAKKEAAAIKRRAAAAKRKAAKKAEPEPTRDEALGEVAEMNVTLTDGAEIALPKGDVEILDVLTANKAAVKEIIEGVGSAFGFTLYINCVPLGETYIDLAQLLKVEGTELAEAKGQESYYSMNAFERRDLLAAEAGVVAGNLQGQNVVALGGTPDETAYLGVLRGFAAKIIQGVA